MCQNWSSGIVVSCSGLTLNMRQGLLSLIYEQSILLHGNYALSVESHCPAAFPIRQLAPCIPKLLGGESWLNSSLVRKADPSGCEWETCRPYGAGDAWRQALL